MKLWSVVWPYAFGLLLICGSLLLAYEHGVSVTETKCSVEWSKRDTKDQLALAIAEAAEREKEETRQRSINKTVQDGQKIIDQVAADAAADRASSNGLRRDIDKLTEQLSTSQARINTCAANASEAATRAALVLADVLKSVDQRAGELAKTADQARARGLTCEKAYTQLKP